jgi:transcriptional regulator with XRE-family HTH domain
MEGFADRVAEHVGRRIRRRRRAIDMTQERLAERAGIHRTEITLIESGRRMPLTYTLIKLAAGLGVSVDQLVAGIEWEPAEGPPDSPIEEVPGDGDDG